MLLLSSFHPQPTAHFEGYCWIGADFIAGQEGADQYLHSTGEQVGPDHDGCYTVVSPMAEGWLVGTDSRGLARLFIFRSGNAWAIGSSLYGLVQHLRAHGINPTPRHALLAPYSQRSAFTSQPTTPSTIFEEITLVPSFQSVTIKNGWFQIAHFEPRKTKTYEESLEEYISTWRSRLITLLSHTDVSFSADLSGGLDSRTVLSFLLSSEMFDTDEDRFRLVSAPGREKDFAAASRIASHFRLTMNGPGVKARGPRSEGGALDGWKEACLGVYLPVYFEKRALDPFNVQAHGAGGGTFRPAPKAADIGQRLDRYRPRMRPDLFEEWKRETLHGLERLQAFFPDASPQLLHYREFRNRFHFGHKPHRRTVFTPLNTAMTDALTDGPNGVSARKLYFDIMENLAPGLKDFPYDDPAKAPTPELADDITRVNLRDPAPGAIYGEAVSSPDRTSDISNAYEAWIDEAHHSLESESVRHVVGSTVIENGTAALHEAAVSDRPLGSHHRGMLDLSFARTVEFALSR